MSDPRGWRKQEDAIEAAKAEILAKMAEGGGAVKSIQRGMFSSGYGSTTKITINAVPLDKSLLLLQGTDGVTYISEFTGDTFSVVNNFSTTTIYWQVIEFY